MFVNLPLRGKKYYKTSSYLLPTANSPCPRRYLAYLANMIYMVYLLYFLALLVLVLFLMFHILALTAETLLTR